MATVSLNKGNNRWKCMLSEQELNTVIIALALLNVQDMENEMEEQNLSTDDVVYDHLTLFDKFTKFTKLYPVKQLETGEAADESM